MLSQRWGVVLTSATSISCEARHARPSRYSVAPIVRTYLALTKPKIAALITFTSLVGTFLATPSMPAWSVLFWGDARRRTLVCLRGNTESGFRHSN